MTTLTATLTLNIDGNEYQKTVTFTPSDGRAVNEVFQWANSIIRPIHALEEEAKRQLQVRDYDEWIAQRITEAKSELNPQFRGHAK